MLDKPFDWETVQLPINMMDAQFRSFGQEIVPICLERGIGVIGMKTLSGWMVRTMLGSTGLPVLGNEALLGAIPLEDMDLVTNLRSRQVTVNPASPNIPSALVVGATE
ncbi:MAG: hypothetical protein OXK76_12490 [Gammaproteobacteria bacterium]|nr:hypothetical protein [Gammaproteobacteria bacterium]